jgi:hypothetical protein
MKSLLLSQVGTLDLLDLKIISEYCYCGFLPNPFMFTQRTRFDTLDEASAYATTVPDRFRYGDLSTFQQCAIAYLNADIRVECHVQYIPANTPSVRAIACRTGQLGFIGVQQPHADAIDVYTVSPYDLGAAIADVVPLDRSGGHPTIVVPQYVRRPPAEFETEELSVSHRLSSSTETKIRASEVIAYATVQSDWRPARNWGFDRSKPGLVWVRIRGDGDYIYAPDHACARPMTKLVLQDRIDRLIADDIAILKDYRRDCAVFGL